jgi:hypothetical protein
MPLPLRQLPQPRDMKTEGGYMVISILLALAFFSVALAAGAQVWHTAVQRSKEAELLFIGDEFKHAIESYYGATPGPMKQLPRSLDALLLDTRYPGVRRHLRRIYVDPMTGKAEWGLVQSPAGIKGVYSLSEREPFNKRVQHGVTQPVKQVGGAANPGTTNPGAPNASAIAAQSAAGDTPPPAAHYSDWKFIADLDVPAVPAPAPVSTPRLRTVP